MVFNSLTFVVFFAVVLMLHALPFSATAKKRNLLVASYLFYAAWAPPFVLLLWLSTAVDWWAARRIASAGTQGTRRAWLCVSLVANLGMLGWFKYGGFLIENTQAVAAAAGIAWQPPAWDVVLPVGISFYTFATLSYTIDVYRGRIAPARSLLDFALFVTFFPHLVAGPIMRASQLLPQFLVPRQASADQLRYGLLLVSLGLFQKVVLADGFLAAPADLVYGAGRPLGFVDAWIGTIAFGAQIFCDFAGYSTTAIGVALCLGYNMPDNFRFPYAAIGFRDFWRRWHVSLSTWLRDYVYIPLGGSRHGEARTLMSLMLTMLLGGLWHGAAWTFVVWGGLHGLYLVAERHLRASLPHWRPGWFACLSIGALTWIFVHIAWVFFRAPSLGEAIAILHGMAGLNADAAPLVAGAHITGVVLIAGGMVATHAWLRRSSLESVVSRVHPGLLAAGWALMAFAILVEQGEGDAFIYFQF
jgi:alginate O-acetyltransferase complex protein AlgI